MMGPVGRKPLLPAPTDSLVGESSVEEPGVIEDVATDLSVHTDRTHHTIPEDGSPITISTSKNPSRVDKFTKTSQTSQTSLLIEYFEGGKGSDPQRRPSVRVKVIPSRSKNKDKPEGHIVLTEAVGNGTRSLSTTRRISLGSKSPQVVPVGSDISALESLHHSGPRDSAPLDIEIQQTSDMSELSASPEARYIPAPSDISSMPPDSMLGMHQSTLFQPTPKVVEGSNVSSLPPDESILDGSEVMESTSLKPPVIPRERNLSNERITQKVIEKLSNKPRETVKISHGRSEKGSSRSTSREIVANPYERSRTTGKPFRETDSTLTSATEPSILSNSVISAGARSDPSIKSNNSINNPKLLQTVEDAIRRLILPELKELKKDQRHQSQKTKFDNSYSDLSENSLVQEKTARRSTSGSKSRRRSSKDHAESSGSRRRKSSHREVDYDSLSDSDSRRDASISSFSAEDPSLKKKRGSGHRTRDPAAAGIAGAGLTAAALHGRDSEESVSKTRRRRHSKGRSSRSGSAAESEEIFEKHKVPPMPMQSEISSDLTRSSILSSNTATSHTPTQRQVQQVVRGAPHELHSPISNSPPRISGDGRQSLGMHHGNFSEHNLSSNRLAYEEHDNDSLSPETDQYHSFSAEDILTDQERLRQYERNLHTQHPIRRGLSPIQSVASYQTTEPNRHSLHHPRSQDSLASMKRRQQQLKEEVSISSFNSASPEFKKTHAREVALGNRSESLNAHNKALNRSPEFQSIGIHDRFSDDEHDQYRDSYATDNRAFDSKRFSEMTDTSSDLQYVDQVTAGQHVVPIIGAKPEFVSAPIGVESGVASLVEPSIVSAQDSQPSHKSSFARENLSNRSLPREVIAARMTSPLKEYTSVKSGQSSKERIMSPRRDLSPPQSPALSYEENAQDYVQQDRSRSSAHSPLPEERVDEKGSPESEITTNPSVIHGPIGGLGAGRPEPWVPNTATPPMPNQGGISRDFSSGAIDLIPEGLNVNQRHTYDAKPNTYVIGATAPTPPGGKMDEGYQTGDNYPSPGPLVKSKPTLNDYDMDDEFGGKVDDPFTTKRNQYMSGLSQGMSPLYDGATGRGIDRIASKDIVALMDHLTVRDAQRNARDTEILVTLVRSAADMRNSFEEMKAFIAEQDEMIMSTADKQHAHTQKVVGGPRPQPQPASTRGTRTPTQDDMPNKRRNVFKRALQGLGSKNTAELQNIESMLMQLLDEMEALRSHQGGNMINSQPHMNSFTSDDAARPPTETGYEPEGRAGTASTGADRSGVFSTNSSRQGQYSAARRVPENRVSTVMEGDEDFDEYGTTRQLSDNQRTPRAASPGNGYAQRAQSEPLNTPPGMRSQSQGALSNEHTPTTSYYSGDKKHKTFSSILPKVVSRWSKTTASSGGDDYRQSTQSRARPYSQVSRSGDAIHEYEYENNPDDRLRSTTSLQDDRYYREQENRPPSPLVPSAISDNPKYQAHRDSQNLEHPQPRQGSKYQYRLENAAHSYHNDDALSPVSQGSSNRWDGQGQQQRQQQQAYAPRNLSPISDRAYSDTGSIHQRSGSSSSLGRRNQGPPRPPKILDNDEPLVPQRASKLSQGTMSPSTYVDNVRAARGSPAFDKSPISALRSPQSGNIARKPSGPRPLSSQSNKDMQKKTRFTNSPVQSIDSDRY